MSKKTRHMVRFWVGILARLLPGLIQVATTLMAHRH